MTYAFGVYLRFNKNCFCLSDAKVGAFARIEIPIYRYFYLDSITFPWSFAVASFHLSV